MALTSSSALRTMRASGRRSICSALRRSARSSGTDNEPATAVVVRSDGRPAVTLRLLCQEARGP